MYFPKVDSQRLGKRYRGKEYTHNKIIAGCIVLYDIHVVSGK
jgi:hypothetical protein